MFKLRAADARARHEWVSRIRSVAEMHTMAIAQVRIKVGLSIDVRKNVHWKVVEQAKLCAESLRKLTVFGFL